MLVQHNISLLSVDKDGRNIWHFAARSFDEGSREYREVLFSTYFQDSQEGLSMRKADGLTPLDQAFEYAQLIEDKDAIIALISHCHRIPLFWEGQGCIFPRAFNLQSEDIIRLLLQCGLDPEASGFSTASPLHYLDSYVSLEWVVFIKSLFPHNHVSRHMARLPIELYVDACIKDTVLPEAEILAQLTFDDLFWNFDDEGRDAWRYLCSSDKRLGSRRVQHGWNCLKYALTHYIQQGCLVAYEENKKEFGLVPLIRMLDEMNRNYAWPPSVMRGELLSKSLALSGYWKTDSRLAIRFLKATIAMKDVDAVKCLLDKSVPVNDPGDNSETIIQYAFGGETALSLCSSTKGRIILMSILETQSLESLKAASGASPNGGLIYGLIHQRWQKSDARWILEYLARIGVDIDGVDESPQSARGATPLAYHLQHDSLAMSEVLLEMGASLNGKDHFLITYRPVHLCSASGNVAFLRKILEVSKRTNAPVLWEVMAQWRLKLTTGYYFDSMSGFHIACYKGDRECVKFFLKEIEIDIRSTSRLGHTALHFAAMNGDKATIKRLCRYGFDVMAKSKEKATPLHIAVTENRAGAVRTLIQLGAKSSMDNLVRTPLMIAQFQDNAEIIEILENEFGKQSDDSVDERHTARLLLRLKSAIEHGDLAGCQSLTSKGCPLNKPLPRTGNASPLTYALVRHQATIAEWLCQTGASVLSVNDFKVTSMHTIITAARYPRLSTFLPTLLQRFIDQGGNWDDLAFRLIAQAAASGNEPGLKVILTHLPTHTTPSIFFERRPKLPGAREGPNLNLLHFCVHQNRRAVVQILLESGCPVDVVDGSGATPLSYARESEMVDLLVAFGASPTPLLTTCLANNFHFWGRDSTRVFDTLTHAFQEQSGLAPLGWVGTSLPAYYDSTYMRPGSLLPLPHFLEHYRNGSPEVVNYLAGLFSGIGLGPLLQGNTELHEVEPFPWHLYQPASFSKITFLKNHFHLFCQRFGRRNVKRWANLEPAQGWSPLCRAASQNCTERMENCLSLGADIEFEGCPLGSALMIASACGQLDAVKLLVRRNAKVSYEGRAGRLSVFKVAISTAVWEWLLVGRFTDQRRIKHTPEHDSMIGTKFWSGPVQARANLHGYELVRDNEARIDCAKRLMLYKRIMRGRVAPYIDGLIFNRHQEPNVSAFSNDR
ncbi:uncharacterized protein FIESC28_01848 [Fusarium coffeatum]|uniref:Uncharacterized protein n=1 Tax=Fusarium coffeatum TaxID=231269 RepID=A0A366S7V0_9HYPO|nr:uncharacterized protein FIESC28_01848 [Fusarium coffeatum]RBR25411.1 hypothetical protein FIESC28_01848 [Fusarium coffeatum]